MTERKTKRQWRFYETAAGGKPAKEFIDALPDDDSAQVYERMKIIREDGLEAARHLRGDVYELHVEAKNRSYRVLFSTEGRFSHVLLAVHAIEKRTQRTPPREIDLAERRLTDWRSKGRRPRRFN